MTSYKNYLKIASYWLLAICLYSVQAIAADNEAASVLFSHGTVTVTTTTGSHDLAKGDSVTAGSTIDTGNNGRVQLRFSDGGLVSLMPNSTFAVDKYSQPAADSEGSVSMSLVKGGLRALTGTIGKKNQDAYELKTKVATLGIRGTQYIATYDNSVMRVHVGDGSIVLFNEFGELLLTAGQSGVVFEGQAPEVTAEQPNVASISSSPNRSSDSDETADRANSVSHSLPGHMLALEAMEDLDDGIPRYLSAYFARTDDGDTSPLALSARELSELSDIYRYISFADDELSSIKLAENVDGEILYTADNLVWGHFVTEETLSIPTGGLVIPEDSVLNYFMIAQPAGNFPTTGVLSYRLDAQVTDNASTVSSFWGGDDYSYRLTKLDLDIQLDGNMESSLANIDIEVEKTDLQPGGGSVDYVQFNTNNPERIYWASESPKQRGSFTYQSAEKDFNENSILELSGVLAGNGLESAGVIYNLREDSGNQLSGMATLDLDFSSRELIAAYSSEIHGDAMSPNLDSGKLDELYLGSIKMSGSFLSGIQTELANSNPDMEVNSNLQQDRSLIWGVVEVLENSDVFERNLIVLADTNLSALPMTGNLLYRLDKSISTRGSELTEFQLGIELGTSPQFSVDMALANGIEFTTAVNDPAYGSWEASVDAKGGFSFAAYDADNCFDCYLQVAGSLAGANHEQAGIVYQLDEAYVPGNDIVSHSGAAILTKD